MKHIFPHGLLFACAIALVVPATGCDDDPGTVRPSEHAPFLSSNLQSNCYSWPEQPFSPDNVATVNAALTVGSKAVDFQLEDLEGNVYRLSTLLKSRPVALVLGAYT